MAFSTPYVTDEYTAYEGEVITTTLSFAVSLIDDYTKDTKGKPIGRIKVTIKETGKKAIENLSGYYCFTNLMEGIYIVSIDSDLYFPEEREIHVPYLSASKDLVLEIVLKPKPEYPFPANATLVRGKIELNSEKPVSKKPVAGIRVGVEEKNVENITDSRGEFVLYFTDLKKIETLTLMVNDVIKDPIEVKEGETVIKNFNIDNI